MLPDAHVFAPDRPVPPPCVVSIGTLSSCFFGCYGVRVILTLSPDGLLSENTRKACEGEEAPSRVHGDQRDVVTIRERFEEGKATELYRTTIMISTRLVVNPTQHSRFGAHGLGTAWGLATRTERSQQSGTYSFQLV